MSGVPHSAEAAKRSVQMVPTPAAGDDTCAVPACIDRRPTEKADTVRLLTSHAVAQARGLRSWLDVGAPDADCWQFVN
eukprot:5668748-Pyramimonas_sp.AAC.1